MRVKMRYAGGVEPKVETPLRPALETKLLEVLEQMDAIQDVRTVGNVVFDVPAHGRTHFGPRFGDDLEPLLTADPRFGDRGHLMVAADGGSISFYPRDVGSALLRKLYHSRSPEATLAWLTKVLGTKSAKGLSISILHGVQVEKAVELTPGVSLVPLKDVPNTFQLQRLSSIDLGSGSFMGWNPPSAALVSPREISPFVYDGRIQNEALLAKNNDAYLRSHALHTNLSRVLCLLGPCLPLIVEWWFVFDDPASSGQFR